MPKLTLRGRRSRSLIALVREAAHIDHTGVDPRVAVRNAIGFALPMAVGELTGGVPGVISACVGALLGAFADQPGPYRLRMLRWVTVALGSGLYTGLAVAASRSTAASVVLLGAVSFGAGLLWAAGETAATIGMVSVLCGVVMGHLAEPASEAVRLGVLNAAGVAGQGVLALLAWPLARHRPERLVVVGLYEQLGAAARSPVDARATPPASDAVETAREALYGIGNAGPSADHYRRLLSEAERIRSQLITLAALADRLTADGARHAADAVDAARRAAGDLLLAAAAAIGNAAPLDAAALPAAEQTITRTQQVLRNAATDGQSGGFARPAATALDGLAGQLRALARATGGTGRPVAPLPSRPALPWRPGDVTAAIRSGAGAIDRPVLQHACRLALLMSATDLVGRLLHYPRAYWIPLTIVIVLKPDFATTFQWTTLRVAGSLLGLVLTWALLRWVLHSPWPEIAAAGALMFLARMWGAGNVGFAAINISGFVVLLLNLDGYAANSLIVNRALATVIGGAVVVLAMLAWPTWERRYVPIRLTELLDAYHAYVQAIADPWSTPARRQHARIASRIARSNAEVSLERAASEPVSAPGIIRLGRSVLATSHRIIRALVTLDALRDGSAGVDDARPELTELLTAAAQGLRRCTLAIRENRPPTSVVPLRARQLRLIRSLPETDNPAPERLVLAEATDRLTDSIDTLIAELGERLPVHVPASAQSRVGEPARARAS